MPKNQTSKVRQQAPSVNVTVKDVAKLANVSAMTVSRVVNAPTMVSDNLREKVQAAIHTLGYIPNKTASGLHTARNKIIGFLMPDLSVPIYHQIHVGLTSILEPEGYSPLVIETRYDATRERALAQTLLGWRPSGVIRVPTGSDDSVRDLFRQAGVPVCEFADSSDPGCELGAGYCHEEMGRRVTADLLAQGPRHIGVVMPRAVPRFRSQLQGVRQAARKVPGSKVTSLMQAAPSPLNMRDGANVIQQLSNIESKVDVLLFFSDVPAAGAMLECQRQGINVPSDLAIVGYGDYEIASQMVPPLTSVRVDGQAIGRACASLLLSKIANPDMPDTIMPIGYELVQRQST